MSVETIIAIVVGILVSAAFYFLGRRDGRRTERKAIKRERAIHDDQKRKIVQEVVKEVTRIMQVKYPGENFNQPLYQDMIQTASATAAESAFGAAGTIVGGKESTVWTFGKGAEEDPGKLRFLSEDDESKDAEEDKSEEEP